MAAPPSPRLPSPPPFTEVQIEGSAADVPRSPISKAALPTTTPAAPTATKPTSAATRRIRPGSRSRDINIGPSPLALNELDSAFQLQEHLASLLTEKTTTTTPGSTSLHTIPISKDSAETLAAPPPGVDPQLWCYELTRRLTRDLNHLIVALLEDNCTNKTCPQMRASEWQYLCAVHDPPQSCCAIDYSCHTLDHAATILTSSRYFPSRLSLTAQGGKHLSSIFRRLYRIFAHAWFQHRSVFWEVEGEWGLYLFFKTVSEKYSLIPEDNLTIPREAEGGVEEAVDEFDRGLRGGEGDSGDAEGQDKEKKEGSEDDEEEEDYGSDDSDESDEHSGSGSSSDGGEGEGEGDAFDLELPMEGTDIEKSEVEQGEGGGERVDAEERSESHDDKKEEETGGSEEEGEEIPLLMEQEGMESMPQPARSPSPPAINTPPPSSPSPPPAEEIQEKKDEEKEEEQGEQPGKPESEAVSGEHEVSMEEEPKKEDDGEESKEKTEEEKEKEKSGIPEIEVKPEETKHTDGEAAGTVTESS